MNGTCPDVLLTTPAATVTLYTSYFTPHALRFTCVGIVVESTPPLPNMTWVPSRIRNLPLQVHLTLPPPQHVRRYS